ncbi:MAG TPA: DUF1206 domain-containing protein [Herpetosiphonaceae bacterium]
MRQTQEPYAPADGELPGAARRFAASQWFSGLTRLGYAAKGIVYLLMGWLAILTALGYRAGANDAQTSLQIIGRQPAGPLLLSVIGAGLAGYALWNGLRAIGNFEGMGPFWRLGRAGRLLAYGGLAVAAFRLAASGRAAAAGIASSDSAARHWSAQALSQPFGVWLLAAAGLTVIGVGLWQFYLAWLARFRDELDLESLSPRRRRWLVAFGRVGLAARGAVFGLIGGFLLNAALRHDPREARGLGGALNEIARQDYGQLALAAVAAGLVCHGLYSLGEARYHRLAGPREAPAPGA